MSVETLRKKLDEIKAEQERLGECKEDQRQQLINQINRKWELCAALAEDLFANSEIQPLDKAFVAYAYAKSLSNLDRFSLALEPAQIACYMAREAGDFELLGRSLMELAYIQGHLPGQELSTIETNRRFLENKDRYPLPLRKQAHTALFNLAIMERSRHRHQEALQHFREARDEAWSLQDYRSAETYRQLYTWQALKVGNLTLAEQLMKAGVEYLKSHPEDISAQISDLHDRAQYALLKGNTADAAALAMRSIPLAEKLDDASALARGVLIWSDACERTGDPDVVVGLTWWAHVEAQRSQRPDLVAEVQTRIRGLRLQYREAVERFIAEMLKPA